MRLLTTEGDAWLYLRWDAQAQKQVPSSAQPLPLAEALQMVERVHTLAKSPGVVLRFCALKALTKANEAETEGQSVVPWKLTLSLRHPGAQELNGLLNKLSHCAVMQIVLTRLRPATQQRSPLAKQIARPKK